MNQHWSLDLSQTNSPPEVLALGLGNTWRGVLIKTLVPIHLPPDLAVPILPSDLQLQNFLIGSGGISGTVSGNWSPSISGRIITGPGSGSLFGIPFGLKSISLTIQQNSITGSEIKGSIVLPFFDHVLDVQVTFDLSGNTSITIDSDTGIDDFVLSAGGTDLLRIMVSELSVEVNQGILSISIGGQVTPLFGDIDWPTFDIKKLSIDSKGDIHIEGGWIDLPRQCL